MEIRTLKKVLNMAWSKETCVPSLRDNYDDGNKSLGQCAITALVVNDYFGGKIMRCMTSTGSHYYNMIDDEIVDLTAEQFIDEVPLYNEGAERTREYLLSNDDTKSRYLMLLKNVRKLLSNKLICDSIEIDNIIDDINVRKKRRERMRRYDEYE